MAAPAPPCVSRLGVTAIKGLGVVHPDVVDLTPTGVAGDRAFFLVDGGDALRSAFRTGAWLGHTAVYDASAGSLAVSCPDGSRVAGEVRLGDAVLADFYRYEEVEGASSRDRGRSCSPPRPGSRCGWSAPPSTTAVSTCGR